MGKKKGKKDKIVILKSREDRVREIIEVIKKLRNLGLDNKFEGIKEFNKITREYIEDGESRQGKIKILGTKRILEYILPKRKNTEITINLKYSNDV
tara:strand:- start:140 stop:427 length:288 start_codon:yes stop_codon:yes gene_type:complete